MGTHTHRGNEEVWRDTLAERARPARRHLEGITPGGTLRRRRAVDRDARDPQGARLAAAAARAARLRASPRRVLLAPRRVRTGAMARATTYDCRRGTRSHATNTAAVTL